ncbi:hypothetical protein MANES_16G013201v8 [Manihot esculenta]|uniref:Uncharacterized protein n=1 Tax=Manihot esculenta TaxID=3983 RepID=A0ACB7G4W4_MANES|nr:hypothetical protein MANES_16G013201v8 [Manihot esculenta]
MFVVSSTQRSDVAWACLDQIGLPPNQECRVFLNDFGYPLLVLQYVFIAFGLLLQQM